MRLFVLTGFVHVVELPIILDSLHVSVLACHTGRFYYGASVHPCSYPLSQE